jgi:dolichyl-phosphate-mannose--protein O-mannosyl transferase
MTATLDRPAALDTPDWRDRLQPLVHGGGGWGVTLLVTVVAGLLRFLRLDQPATTLTDKGVVQGPADIFDEVYYACDAYNLVTHGVEKATAAGAPFCTPTDAPAFVVHPPLGKWLIGLGEKAFGFDTFGWRFAAAVVGTLTVLLVIRIGRRMTGSTLLGGLAGLLLALDGLHFVQSRVAMLDVFLVFWVVAAFAALLVDRDHLRARLTRNAPDDLDHGGRLGHRPWRLVAGVCAGAAVATKWSALFPLAVMVLLSLAWEASARRSAGVSKPRRTTVRRTAAGFGLAFVLLPTVVYLASWTGWFVQDDGWSRNWADGRGTSVPYLPDAPFEVLPDATRSLWHYHWEIYHFHATLDASHPYQSHPLSWPFLGRPVSYYYPPGITEGRYGCEVSSCSREVLAIGTPALWWAMVPVCLGLAARWVSRRDWRATALLAMTSVSILAWIPSALQDRTMFLFYALPAIPFLCLGIALLAGWLIGPAGARRRTTMSAAVGVYTSLVLVNFAYLYPILAAVTIPYADWYDRMWFRSWI